MSESSRRGTGKEKKHKYEKTNRRSSREEHIDLPGPEVCDEVNEKKKRRKV
jgi:hypothetical protein